MCAASALQSNYVLEGCGMLDPAQLTIQTSDEKNEAQTVISTA